VACRGGPSASRGSVPAVRCGRLGPARLRPVQFSGQSQELRRHRRRAGDVARSRQDVRWWLRDRWLPAVWQPDRPVHTTARSWMNRDDIDFTNAGDIAPAQEWDLFDAEKPVTPEFPTRLLCAAPCVCHRCVDGGGCCAAMALQAAQVPERPLARAALHQQQRLGVAHKLPRVQGRKHGGGSLPCAHAASGSDRGAQNVKGTVSVVYEAQANLADHPEARADDRMARHVG
jgi:hypothetical protein